MTSALGGYPLVSLAEAREAAFLNRKLARAGGDPLAEKRKAKLCDAMPTLREAAEMTYKTYRLRWRNDKVAANWMQELEAPRNSAPRRLAGRPHLPRGRCRRVFDSDLDRQAGNGQASTPMHQGNAAMVRGKGLIQFNAAGVRRCGSDNRRAEARPAGSLANAPVEM